MVRSMTWLLVLAFLMLIGNSKSATAQGWAGILPLKTTRSDVVHLQASLGQPANGATIITNEAKVNVDYYSGGCEPNIEKSLKLSPDTVIGVNKVPRTELMLLTYVHGIYSENLEKIEISDGVFAYLDFASNSIALTESTQSRPEIIREIHYLPSFAQIAPCISRSFDSQVQLALQLSSRAAKQVPGSYYSNIMYFDTLEPSKGNIRDLEEFLNHLLASKASKGYIIAYAGKKAIADETQKRIELLNKYINSRPAWKELNISFTDGGFNERASATLLILPETVNKPVPTPTFPASQVVIVDRP